MKLWKIFRQKYKYALRWYRNLQFWFYIENLFPRTIKLSFPSRRCSFFIFLNSAGKTEARPTDVLQPYSPEENGSFLWLGELENPNPNRKESGLGDEKFLNLQNLHHWWQRYHWGTGATWKVRMKATPTGNWNSRQNISRWRGEFKSDPSLAGRSECDQCLYQTICIPHHL